LSNPRANLGHILIAAGGVLLALFTFLSWFGPGDVSAWEVFNIVDVVIFLGALVAAGIAAANLAGAAANLPPQVTSVQRWLGAVPALLAIAFIIEIVAGDGEIEFGGFLSLIAALVLLAGTIMLVRPDIAAKVNEATAGLGGGPSGPGGGAVGPGPGAGPGATPGAGAPGGGPAAAAPAPPAATPSPAAPPAGGPSAPTPASAPASPAPSAEPAGAESSGPAAGWYPDPQGQKRLRYWDGGRWTEQTAD
jgi:hypothetical protein